MSGLSETTENYLKQIYILVDKHGSARISDIADRLGRSLSTVTGAVKRMASEDLINYKAYGKITLTDKGDEAAAAVLKKYNILIDFLITIGVDHDTADKDACEMEHISEDTMSRLTEFLNFMKSDINAKQVLVKYQDNIDE